jgi:hypothetical protein
MTLDNTRANRVRSLMHAPRLASPCYNGSGTVTMGSEIVINPAAGFIEPCLPTPLCRRVTSATIDDNVVVCDRGGVTDFDSLRSTLARRSSREAFLYAFDLLELDGEDLRPLPWTVRREDISGG